MLKVQTETKNPEYENLKRYVVELEKSETRFHNIVSDYPGGIGIIDEKRIIRFVNHAFEEIIGLGQKELLGNKFDFSIREGKTSELEFHHKSGMQTIAEVYASRTTWDGEPAFLVSLKDITQRKRMEVIEQRLRQERTLQFLAKTLGVDLDGFTSKASQALNSISEQTLHEELQVFLDQINRSTVHCQILAKQLMFLGNCHRISRCTIHVNQFIQTLEPRIDRFIGGMSTVRFGLLAENPTINADKQQFEHLIFSMLTILLKPSQAPNDLLIETQAVRLLNLDKQRPKPTGSANNAVSVTVRLKSTDVREVGFQAFRQGLVITSNEDLVKQVIDQIVRKHSGEFEICKDHSAVVGLRIVLPLAQTIQDDTSLDPRTEIEITNLFESTVMHRSPPHQYL